MKIADGCTVTIDYTMTIADGEVVDSTEETEPLSYIQGEGEIITGLEEQMLGLEKGGTLEVDIPAAEGFGDSDPEAFIEIPKTDLPPEALQVDAQLQGEGPQGQAIEGRVVEVKENSAVVDFNHPLAGRDLHFSVTVVDVQPQHSA
jgi:FKBP-type peptidyl-prolyl cis-trans isomerase SlyD